MYEIQQLFEHSSNNSNLHAEKHFDIKLNSQLFQYTFSSTNDMPWRYNCAISNTMIVNETVILLVCHHIARYF